MGLVLADRMRSIGASGSKAFVPFLTAGYPDPATFRLLLEATAGADFVEIGLPFSDPVADGPSICHASDVALAAGMHADRLFDLLGGLRNLPPLIVMTYLNPVLAYGAETFLGRAAAVGVRGLIVTDLPPEDAGGLFDAAAACDIASVLLVAPTTSAERMRAIAGRTTGFLYCVAVTGTTGARQTLGAGARDTVQRLRAVSDVPVVVGFGISTPEQVRQACGFADGVVVGSALVDVVRSHRGPDPVTPLFAARLRALAAAAHGA